MDHLFRFKYIYSRVILYIYSRVIYSKVVLLNVDPCTFLNFTSADME